MFRNIIG